MKVEQVKFSLWVHDMNRALAFWRDAVGLAERMTSPYWSASGAARHLDRA